MRRYGCLIIGVWVSIHRMYGCLALRNQMYGCYTFPFGRLWYGEDGLLWHSTWFFVTMSTLVPSSVDKELIIEE